MGETTKIAWTDHTFNPWWGCQRVSPGCEHCYAETFSKRVGLKVWGPAAERRFFGEKHWAEPHKWNRDAAREGVRRRVFCASMADVFEDRPELSHERAILWRLIANTPHLDWLLLTKRPENVGLLATLATIRANDVAEPPVPQWPANIWLGTTAEDQKRADDRISTLLAIGGPSVRFVSYEPALEEVSFFAFMRGPLRDQCLSALRSSPMPGIDWLIVGGESGPGARPFALEWAERAVDQCRAAKVPVFVKQLGAHVVSEERPGVDGAPWGWRAKLANRKGGDMAEWPESLRVREFPDVRA